MLSGKETAVTRSNSFTPCIQKEVLSKLYCDYVEDVYSFPSKKEPRLCGEIHTTSAATGGPDIFHLACEKFPFIYVSPSTVRILKRKQSQVALSHPPCVGTSTVLKKVSDMQEKHTAIQHLLHKDLLRTLRLQELKLDCEQKQAVKSAMQNKRGAAARARRYMSEYESNMSNKLQGPRTKEEQTLIGTFNEALHVHKEQLRQQQRTFKERHAKLEKQICDHLIAKEIYYNDQLSLLADGGQHRKQNEVISPLQHQILRIRTLRKVEMEVKELQHAVFLREDDVQHFRDMDAKFRH